VPDTIDAILAGRRADQSLMLEKLEQSLPAMSDERSKQLEF
jgi:hypothetical protein